MIRFNSKGDGVELLCLTCDKKSWFKSSGENTDIIHTWSEEFQKLKTLVKQIPRYVLSYKNIELIGSGIFPPPIISIIQPVKKINKRHSIPKTVKQEVWQRDNGKCVKCESKENLEYDHIIPVIKGGANTVRNIQLLCESCNRKKQAKIE